MALLSVGVSCGAPFYAEWTGWTGGQCRRQREPRI